MGAARYYKDAAPTALGWSTPQAQPVALRAPWMATEALIGELVRASPEIRGYSRYCPTKLSDRRRKRPETKSGTMRPFRVERPTWPFSAATCRRVERTAMAHHWVRGVSRPCGSLDPSTAGPSSCPSVRHESSHAHHASFQSKRPGSLAERLALPALRQSRPIGAWPAAAAPNGQPDEPTPCAYANTSARSMVLPPDKIIPVESTVTNFPQVIARVAFRSSL